MVDLFLLQILVPIVAPPFKKKCAHPYSGGYQSFLPPALLLYELDHYGSKCGK